ncbi:MAG: SPOR domain-containing protein [Pikeienuella sp.]
MRDDSYLESRTESAQAVTGTTWRGKAATAAGALISVVILATIVVWSYRLGVRDAAEVPVIRASSEAFKSKPDDPGGLDVAHQNREVYRLVAPSGAAPQQGYAPEAERLTSEDVAPSKMETTPQPRPTPQEVVIARPATTPAPAAVEAPAPAQTAAPAENAATGAATTTEADTATAAPDAEAIAEAGEPNFAPTVAPRPNRRPVRTASVAPVRAEADEPRAAAAASLVQIQLGAFVTEEIAASQWTALKSRNGDLLNGRGRVIMPVTSGGRQLYRLRAGPFETVSDASALCRGLKARGEDCIVASAR